MEERIQKILAQRGLASRRKAEEYIVEGRVTVNGKTAELGMKADPEKDYIKVDGKLLTRPEPKVYLMFNKPRGVVTSLSDPQGRPTVKDYLKGVRYRVFPVGRLDYDTEGMLLITNDGDLAQALMHPSKEKPKTYLAKVKGVVEEEKMEKLRHGIKLEDGMTAPAWVKTVSTSESNSWVEVVIHEGRKRQVRRMMEKVGHPVIKLKRTGIAGLKLGNLEPGELRPLTQEEVRRLSGSEPDRKPERKPDREKIKNPAAKANRLLRRETETQGKTLQRKGPRQKTDGSESSHSRKPRTSRDDRARNVSARTTSSSGKKGQGRSRR